jgi:glutamate--cysteine ligase
VAPSAVINRAQLSALDRPNIGLNDLRRGIEKESLRVAIDGTLSDTGHPPTLGSPLTHPSITTDFSEAQLELITGVHASAEGCLDELNDIHRFVYRGIHEELMWPSSMPCLLGDDDDIPLGQYGTSNIAQAKTVYRRGLGNRYGRLMQTISGIHYNFSLPESLWLALGYTDQDARTRAYFGLIRNFRRWSWLLIYLFGASPAVCRSFARTLEHNLEPFDEGTLYKPNATSLRMGPLGYQSKAQSDLHISYNSLDEYAASMAEALTRTYPPYEAIGTEVGGVHQQLNTAVLQIENEFYGTIRPKRRTHSGERPLTALRDRGVEYVEVRCVDLNPFLRVGIDEHQVRFIDAFLLVCLLADSEQDSEEESMWMARNQLSVVENGRQPGLELEQPGPISLSDWAMQLLDSCEQVARHLDKANGGDLFSYTVEQQKHKVTDPELTPSARVLKTMREQGIPFFRFTMNQAIAHKGYFIDHPLRKRQQAQYDAVAAESLAEQADIERADTQSFEEFLEVYLAPP